MKHLNFNNIAIALLMVIVVISLYKMQKTKENYRNNHFAVQLSEEVYEKILGGLIVAEGRKITNNEFLVLDQNIDTVKIESSIQKNTLLIYYNEINCMVCIEEALKQLMEKANLENDFDYQIIAKYENLRDVLMFKKANSIKKEILKPIIVAGDKSVFMDDAFIAVVDQNYELHHVFFLDTESKNKLPTYLSLINYSKYLNRKEY